MNIYRDIAVNENADSSRDEHCCLVLTVNTTGKDDALAQACEHFSRQHGNEYVVLDSVTCVPEMKGSQQ